jgi:D-glycero-D-manno-heptose 1,7-bisphosphate phosphatase
MNAELQKLGARIDAFYFCPHHPKGALDGYTRECDCRKPQPGMILQAMEIWRADPATSFLIGDKDSDVEAAAAAGIRGYLFSGVNLLEFVQKKILLIAD